MSESGQYFHVVWTPVPAYIKELPNKVKTEEPKNLIDGFIWQGLWKPIYGLQQAKFCVCEKLIFWYTF